MGPDGVDNISYSLLFGEDFRENFALRENFILVDSMGFTGIVENNQVIKSSSSPSYSFCGKRGVGCNHFNPGLAVTFDEKTDSFFPAPCISSRLFFSRGAVVYKAYRYQRH